MVIIIKISSGSNSIIPFILYPEHAHVIITAIINKEISNYQCFIWLALIELQFIVEHCTRFFFNV